MTLRLFRRRFQGTVPPGRRLLQPVAADVLQLRRVDCVVLGGVIAKPPIPRPGPDESHESKNYEDSSPVQVREKRCHEQRCQTASQVRSHEEDSLGGASLRERKPSRKSPSRIRPGACLAHTEQKADDQQRRIAGGGGCGDCERGPPRHNASENPSRANAIAPPTRGDFKDAVGSCEGAEDKTHLKGREGEIAHHLWRRDRNADAVQVGDCRHTHCQGQHSVTHARWRDCFS